MKLLSRYLLVLGLLLFIGYHSVYFESLSARQKQEVTAVTFEEMAQGLYAQGIAAAHTAVAWETLKQELTTQPDSAFTRFGNRLGIGNSAYFMIKIRGQIHEITTDNIEFKGNETNAILETRYIFGNGLRDASQAVSLTDFKTTSDFNRLSEALNRLVRTQIIPEALSKVTVGDTVSVVGAIKLNRSEPLPEVLHVLPALITRAP